MKQYNLTQSELKDHLHYDPETGLFTRKIYRTHSADVGCVAGTVDAKGYVMIKINYRPYSAHRLAWLYVYGSFPDQQIDHINRNKADNRIANLRLATNGENQRNVGPKRNNTSGVVGVSWRKDVGKWRVQIKMNGKGMTVGYYKNFDDAVAARKEAEKPFNHYSLAGEP